MSNNNRRVKAIVYMREETKIRICNKAKINDISSSSLITNILERDLNSDLDQTHVYGNKSIDRDNKVMFWYYSLPEPLKDLFASVVESGLLFKKRKNNE